ncbi:hypothetical protein OnM2_019084 [Erysiphe neolycopersici]|uniref:Uncharacterized protein n=1 Tax=Erysiphe neolycopersici TaxID=212602 RepID=A0A420I426_9PEZI|nr:hypothetical protein OnM2_019084 [Erysiphe neolycopersici]
MQIRKEMSKIAVRSLCEHTEDHSEATSASLASPTRATRKNFLHREKRSSKRDHLIRLAYSERVHPIVKLLVLTSIPPLRKIRVNNDNSKRSTVNAISEQISVSEKEKDFSTEGCPLDIFLSLQDEVKKVNESPKIQNNVRNKSPPRFPSTRNDSTKLTTTHFQSHLSVPTYLKTSKFASDQCKRLRRKPFYSPWQPCIYEDHPLFLMDSYSSSLDQDNSLNSIEETNETHDNKELRTRSKTALRHKVKKSYHKIKLALNSVSSQFNSPLVPINSSRSTKVANLDLFHTSENLPLSLENVPTSQLRWYLNPVTNAAIEDHPSTLCRAKRQRRCLVSIQMQTYKISASNEHSPHHIISYRTKPTCEDQPDKELVIRRRDMRENSDFLRVVVMEMLMRRRGKLDNQGPGKARMILPPRTLTIRPPEVTADGVPVRWISLSV